MLIREKIKKLIKNFSKEQKALRKEILAISHNAKVAHLGSCLSSVDIISSVYKIKKNNDLFILSNGHAAVALYAVLNKRGLRPKLSLVNAYVHPDRNLMAGIYASTGSLGQGLPIAVGMALAQRKKTVFCVVSDGECDEGSIWESLRIAFEQNLSNLKVIVNANGYGAYGRINTASLIRQIKGFSRKCFIVNGHNIEEIMKSLRLNNTNAPLIIIAKTTVEQLPFLIGQDAHYKVMSNEEFYLANKLLR